MSRQTYADANANTGFDTPTMPDSLSSAEAKLVYFALQVTDGCSVKELHRMLDVQRLSLFPILGTLRERDLIDETDITEWEST